MMSEFNLNTKLTFVYDRTKPQLVNCRDFIKSSYEVLCEN